MPNMGKTIDAFIDEGLRDRVKVMLGEPAMTRSSRRTWAAMATEGDGPRVTLAKDLLGVGTSS